MDKKECFTQMIKEAKSTKERLFYSAVYLFSTYGYANVGIRKLCASVKIKESAFYNHYKSKEKLFNTILDYFKTNNSQFIMTAEEIEHIANSQDIAYFFHYNMQKFSSITNNPLYHTILQIVLMESYTNPNAYEIERKNLYYLRKDYTEQILKKMIENGSIKKCDVTLITAEFYYGLKGLLNEYLLVEIWNGDKDTIRKKIENHLDFFINLLRNN